MSGDVQLELWLHEYKLNALAAALEEEGSTVERRMQDSLTQLYESTVPVETRQEIQAKIDAEYVAARAEEEAARQYTAFRVRESGTELFFRLDHNEKLMDIGTFLRRYLRGDLGLATPAFQNAFAGLCPISAEQYGQMMTIHLENPGKVTGVFDLDFDKREISAVDFGGSWKSYTMKDVSASVYSACRKSGLRSFQYEARFENSLTDKARPSAGHLSTRDISFSDEILWKNGALNFYLETGPDVRTVLGDCVRLKGPGDWLNLYTDYDCASDQVCDILSVELHHADGSQEELAYSLDAIERATLLQKMEEYCLQQTGQTLKDYSSQLLAEDMAPPTAPSM